MIKNLLLFFFLIPVCLTGCNTIKGIGRKNNESQLRYQDYAGSPIQQFTVMRVTEWSPVSRDELVIWGGINEAWLLKVWDSCWNLEFVDSIAVTQTGHVISRFDKVLAGENQCPISEIRTVDVKAMKAARAAAKAKK